MDGLSLAASVIAVIQVAGSCLKLSRRWIGPSEFGSSDLATMTTALYEFNGAMKTFQTHLEIHEDDEARLSSLDYLKPALGRCKEALDTLKDFMEHAGFIGKHLIGPRFDRKLKTSLKALDGGKELFMLALHADQQTILSGVERYIRTISEDLRDIHDIVKDNGTMLGGLDKQQNEYFKQASDWQEEATTNLKGLREGGNKMYQEMKRMRREQEGYQYQTLLDWITPMDYGAQQSDFISRRQEGTGQWLIDSAAFQTWLNRRGQTLFCPGIPGAGKTILTSIVVENLDIRFQDNLSVGVAYLYCNFWRQDEQKTQDLLASLLKQLAQRQSSLPESVKSLYERHKGKQTRPSLDEVSRTLSSVATLYSSVFIIVDALDECQVSGGCRAKFLAEIFSLQAKYGVNLFATSRLIPEITERFKESISLEIRASEEDVRRYLDGHMLQLPGFVIKNPELQEEIKTEIVRSVDGMFLLAKLHLDSLIGKMTLRAIRTELKMLPTGSNAYDHAYKGVMERIEAQVDDQERRAKQILSWITCAMRPLTIEELRDTLAVEPGDTELGEDNRVEVDDTVSVCAGLGTVDEESKIIRLVHYTTQEYFERTQNHWFLCAESEITTTCVTYLSLSIFESGFCQTDDKFAERLYSHHLYQYAAQNWGYHACKASNISQAVVDFLESDIKVEASTQALLVSHSTSSQEFPRQMTALHLTAYFGVERATNFLLKKGVKADSTDSTGWTPLLYAARNGREAVVKLLLATERVNADSKATGYFAGQTPLSFAAEKGHEAIVKLLLATKGVNADSKDSDGRTPLSFAADEGHEATVKLLLATKGVDADSKDSYGRTPLSYAVGKGHEAIVKLLLATKGVDANSKDNNGQTPLSLAARSGHEAVVKLLPATEGVDPWPWNGAIQRPF